MKRTWSLIALLLPLLALAGPQPPEIDYVDEPDEAKAALLLEKLLKKTLTAKDAVRIADTIGKKRLYATGLKDSQTLTFACPDGVSREFTYYLPKKYAPNKAVPVVVWLHGAISQPPPGGGHHESKTFGAAVEELGPIMVGPSTHSKVEWGEPANRALVRHAVDYVKRNFRVDDDRVFLCGDSDGGRGTYAILETLAGTFACAVPVIGSPGGVTRFNNLRNLSLLAINGEKDGLFTIAEVRKDVEGMKASGIDITFVEIAGKGHDPRLFLEQGDAVRKFLAAHTREPFPKTVHWTVDLDEGETAVKFPANTFRWIRIEDAGTSKSQHAFEDASKGLLRAGLPRIEATRDGNRISVRTNGITKYTVLLAPGMVDFAKPVVIETNGNPSFEGTVVADARTVLEEARRFRDGKLVFHARVTVEVDAPPKDK
ncbi:MAG: hypothetical protein FD180_291 [Planctomycetota bacterium]|nr:MAG: hypothetical protein FD180_291 [Planctomycetota bacterium]